MRITLPKLFHKASPGRAPGIAPQDIPSGLAADAVEVSCIDYGPDEVTVTSITDLSEFLSQERPPKAVVRWINVCGLSDRKVIAQLAEQYHLHALVIEDILHIPQRPKVETYPADDSHPPSVFVVALMNRLVQSEVVTEQVSICLSQDAVLTFQETIGDVWNPIRQRIKKDGSRIRRRKTGYLTYSLLDAIVDHNFTILEHYGQTLERLEDQVMEGPSTDIIHRIHQIKRELLMLRRHVWPMREVVGALQREEFKFISKVTRLFLRDAYDHCVQVLDVVETYREIASGLADTHMTVVGNRMNEVMKTLTMVATIFIPISFLAGVFGMNFDDIPGLHSPWAFVVFCVVCVAVAGGMLAWFRRKGWW